MLVYDCNSQKSLTRRDCAQWLSQNPVDGRVAIALVQLHGARLQKPTAAKALQMRSLSAFAFETFTLWNFEKKLYEANASVKRNAGNTIKQLISLKVAMKVQGETYSSKGGVAARAGCAIHKRLKLLEKPYLLCIILSRLGWSRVKWALMLII